jgi:hypothetical protein
MDNTLVSPTIVTALGEDTESQLVSVDGVSIVDITPAGGLNVNVTDGVNTFLVRVDFDTGITEEDINNLQGLTLRITGLGGQFDNSEPYDGGYQLLPRYLEDIEVINATSEPAWAQGLELFPNPVASQLTVRGEVAFETLSLKNKLGQTLRTWNVSGTQASVDISSLPAGMYFLELQAAGEQVTRRVIKQ